MRKFILPILLGLSLISCKKNTSEEVSTTNESENSTTETTTTVSTGLKEFSSAKVSELLQSKNDTLYVTNFFATWCGPCVKEIPHFKEVMDENKGKPVKFTFVNLDDKGDWESEVKPFVEKHNIDKNTILLDGEKLEPQFFTNNFKTWAGDFIPFTIIRKGDKTEEIGGGISKEQLLKKMATLQ